MQMHSFTLTETFQKHIKMLYQCMSLSETHTHIWEYMSLGTTTPQGAQGLRCVTYTLWLRELLISQIWHF